MILKDSGRDMVCLCPFHGEKTPSFRVYRESNSFYCFGCNEGGTVITFIQKIENLSFIEAVKFLAEKSGLFFPRDKVDSEEFLERSKILEANREAAKFYHEFLKLDKTKKGLSYLELRGLKGNIIRKFGIGLSPDSKNNLIIYLKNKGMSDSILLKSGLAIKSYISSELIDRFRKRIMFPIIDQRGNVIAFGGRALDNETKPKYLNSPDTKVFKKRSNLFSLNFAKKSKKSYLILTEGYMDVISLFRIGVENSVATLGTSIGELQAKLIARFKKEVVIIYDSDEAGQKATERAIEILKKAGLLIKVVKIKNFKDPDEFIKNNGKNADYKFLELIKNSKNDVEYKLKNLESTFDKNILDQKIKLLKEGVKVLSNIQNGIEREVFITKFSSDMKINKETIEDQVKRQRKKNALYKENKFIKISKNKKSENKKLTNAEEAILKYLIFYPHEILDIKEKISEEFFTDYRKKVYRVILEKNKNFVEKFNIFDFQYKLEEDEIKRLSSIFAHKEPLKITRSSILECIDTILREKERSNMKNIESLDISSIEYYTNMLKKIKK